MKQLSRTINGITYYCEHISKEFFKAKLKKDAAKIAGFKARVFKIKNEYRVFIH